LPAFRRIASATHELTVGLAGRTARTPVIAPLRATRTSMRTGPASSSKAKHAEVNARAGAMAASISARL
jgi:hypothetical protein